MTHKHHPIWLLSDKDLQKLLDNSYSYKNLLEQIRPTVSMPILKERLKNAVIDFSTFNINKINHYKTCKNTLKNLEDILVENSLYNRTRLKKRLLDAKLLDNKCSTCEISDQWCGKPLVLQLEHINGIHNDNRLENLTLLCPNCHSQTDTYAGRNRSPAPLNTCNNCSKIISWGSIHCNKCRGVLRQQISRPSAETIVTEIKQYGFIGTGRKYGVSDNTIRKWCKNYNLPHKIQDIKQWGL